MREGERGCVCRETRRGKEVGSGPLLLPWRLHPDAAAAVGASGRSESVCGLEGRRIEESRGAPSTGTACHI